MKENLTLTYIGQVAGSYGGVGEEAMVVRELIGGLCAHCGRTRQKTRFCAVCGTLVCSRCAREEGCHVAALRGTMLTHEASERRKVDGVK